MSKRANIKIESDFQECRIKIQCFSDIDFIHILKHIENHIYEYYKTPYESDI